MQNAYLNSIVTAVPEFDIHEKFVNYACQTLTDDRQRALFSRLAKLSQIEHRFSVLKKGSTPDQLDDDNFYSHQNFPDTKSRMSLYKKHAFNLAKKALDKLDLKNITHLIITSCTGFYAPGIDLEIIEHYQLKPSVERTIIGFMGCYAAINALKAAHHIVRSEKSARILILNIELCTLHLQETTNLEDILPFLIFADGCSASIVSSEQNGIEIKNFHSAILENSNDLITWHIGNFGFDMVLSPQVSKAISKHLPDHINDITKGKKLTDFTHYAIHPGGKSILDATQKALKIDEEFLKPSREILREFGNMSSPTIMFVLKNIMEQKISGEGLAAAFGPGIMAETMLFHLSS
jgi:predicted naringenin-chalcone synthase